jgi:predicted nucleotidyltransferase
MQNLSKEIILDFLRENKDFLKETYGVISIGLLGSFARDEQNEESDIDLLTEFKSVSFHKYAGLMIYLEEKFGKKVDIIVNGKYLSEKFKSLNKKDTIYA